MKIDVSVPTLDDFARNGFDAHALFVGTVLIFASLFTGDISANNRLLTIGACIICFGYASRCFSNRYPDVSYYGEKMSIMKGQVVGSMFWGAAALFLAVVTVLGRWPHL